MIPYILTTKSLTAVMEGKAYTMNDTHPSWLFAKDALKAEKWDTLKNLFDVSSAVQNYFDDSSEVEVKNDTVYYKGEVINNYCVAKILEFMRAGLPFRPLVKFFSKLMQNPSRRATDELYRFLEHKSMPLTPDGNFLAYKGVKDDFKDCYTGKFDNSVGQVLEMVRNSVCDDANNGCSSGFHVGSYEYAKGYASGGGNLMVIEVNPCDVVSVPHDSGCQKLRTCKYKVVGHYEHIDAPPLKDGLNEDYTDDYEESDEQELEGEDYDNGYNAGYEAAKKALLDKLNNG